MDYKIIDIEGVGNVYAEYLQMLLYQILAY